MKALVLLVIFLLCFGTMWTVNHFSPAFTHNKIANRCTRYCHDHGCPHSKRHFSFLLSENLSEKLRVLYCKNIEILGRIPGLTYKQANILIYVILFPAFWMALFWIVIGQRIKIRRLKKDRKA